MLVWRGHLLILNQSLVLEQIIDDIETSIFQSKLSHFLLTTKENYFITQRKDIVKDEKDGTADFLYKIRREDEKEFKNIKDLRIKKILDFTRKKQKFTQPRFLILLII